MHYIYKPIVKDKRVRTARCYKGHTTKRHPSKKASSKKATSKKAPSKKALCKKAPYLIKGTLAENQCYKPKTDPQTDRNHDL